MKGIRWTGVLSIFASSLLMIACSSSAPTGSTQPQSAPAAPAKKEPVLYTGKSCFSMMAGMASRWAPDAQPFHMESELNEESNGHDGKATVWRAMFASPTRRTYKVFTCSGSRLPNEPATGVTAGAETTYGPTVPSLMFQAFLLSSDSDQAYTVAQEKGGAKLIEKNPQQPVAYTLDWNPKEKMLLWVVIYGTSAKDSKGMGVIDAGSGRFLHAAK